MRYRFEPVETGYVILREDITYMTEYYPQQAGFVTKRQIAAWNRMGEASTEQQCIEYVNRLERGTIEYDTKKD